MALRFSASELLIDTRIGEELSPINNGIQYLPVLLAGDTFKIELYVKGGRGGKTAGFTIAF
jgi:hypothetical protein